jgi:hypothetical protein
MVKRVSGSDKDDGPNRHLTRNTRAHSSTPKMVINRNIWTVAAWLIAKHGEAAPKIVSARITKLRNGEVETSAISSWLQVDQAVHELTRSPGEGERVN